MLVRILHILLPILAAAALSSRLLAHLTGAKSPLASSPARPLCWTSTGLAASILALTTGCTRLAHAADPAGGYSNVDPEALRRRAERRRQKLREEQEARRRAEHEQQHQRTQYHAGGEHHHHHQGHHHHAGFGGGDGFQHIFEQLFGGGGGGGGFQFTFNGNGMPFGAGGGGIPFGFGGGHRPPQSSDEEANSPRFIRKALKAFGLDESVTANELKKVYRKLAVKYHPDKCGKEPVCEKKMVKVNRYKEALENWIKSRG
ncbi:hypothetical protein BCR44DRAFT_64455 [Catenaria anguillulae PL171]|uniref:J domain-containing protein n=1 Tax=Catenaria anguillulae PL171 TaxID=765915 RepID=A0A1Y2HY01_9FUNG|nr:hypothetical protein BCR44DRAFT_64455 [Catenaria anguillulae PL171]